MRLSTSLIYSQGYDAIARQQGDLMRTQQQIASGKRLSTPADDPIAATQVQSLTHALAQTGMFGANGAAASSTLMGYDAILGQVGDLLQRVRTLTVQAGSTALAPSDRASIATDMAGELQDLLGLANTKDANGKYLFSGFSADTQPFALTPQGATYSGDQGQHMLQVAPGRSVAVNVTGSAAFELAGNGNGTVTTRAAGANSGTGVIAAGSVVNAAALTGHTYRLQFTVAAGVTTYAVLDVTAATTVSSGNAYVDGGAITVAGVQTTIKGAPANGDAFSLAPSTRQSVFATLQNLLATLQAPAAVPGAATRVTNGIAAGLQDLDQGIDNVLTLRSGVGAQLRELDTLGTSLSARTLQYQQSVSELEDLDYNKALSDFARQQVALQAAQQSFAKVSGLSLFNYLSP
jgi:flagellar hook-associated protein 3 FlgL